jgi:hypothetical protein
MGVGTWSDTVMKDICVELASNPEKLAAVSEMLGEASINIEGLCITKVDERTVLHCLVEDGVTAKQVFENAGFKIQGMSEVFVLSKDQKGITGKPGSFGRICKTLAENGIEINFGYPAENNRFVFGVDDVEKVRELLK